MTLPYDARYDLNGDGVIDQADAEIVLALVGTSVGDPRYDPRMDFNGNGAITLADVGAVTLLFGARRDADSLPMPLILGGAGLLLLVLVAGRARTA